PGRQPEPASCGSAPPSPRTDPRSPCFHPPRPTLTSCRAQLLPLARRNVAGYQRSVLSNPVWRLRMVGMAEGLSYIALLGIAMPLKYMADMPIAVRIVGSIHGALFVLFGVALIQAWTD